MFKFIDLFAGIGGFRVALESLGGKCVFSSEIDEHAVQMYQENFGDNSYCDITQLSPQILPDFDVLCAGFPCQAFSICGKQQGFNDVARGTLFFDICRILEEKQPKTFILENVNNLEKHDKGNTLFVMLKALNELGYYVSYKVLNSRNFGVPQNRERIIIVGNKEGKVFDFSKIKEHKIDQMYPFLDKEGDFEFLNPEDYTLLDESLIKTQKKSGLMFCGYRNKKIRTTGVREGTEHLSRVHKQPNRIYSAMGTHPTIASQEQSGRYFILLDGRVRKLTIQECYRFMGFPNTFKLIGKNAKLYERIGNSVCVPMVKSVMEQILEQFMNENHSKEVNVIQFLEETYNQAVSLNKPNVLRLNKKQWAWVKNIVEKEETLKGVYTVLITSLVYKSLYPKQDVRYHQKNLDGGYSGRSFDTHYVTPFLKQKKFLGAMKESGWLTRSLEQNIPYTLDFPGKINSKTAKEAFLQILNDIEEHSASPLDYLIGIFSLSIKEKARKSITLLTPVKAEDSLNINQIINLLDEHFYYPYKSRGASILPVIALYSAYECMIDELKRFEGKKLQSLSSHDSCDRSSGNTGDVVVLNEDNSIYEVLEIKFDIKPDLIMLNDAYNKFKSTTIQRYYILSTKEIATEDKETIDNRIIEIKEEHGCQVIINGVFHSLKYYLRLLENTDKFMQTYIRNVQEVSEINSEHKLAWNQIIQNT